MRYNERVERAAPTPKSNRRGAEPRTFKWQSAGHLSRHQRRPHTRHRGKAGAMCGDAERWLKEVFAMGQVWGSNRISTRPRSGGTSKCHINGGGKRGIQAQVYGHRPSGMQQKYPRDTGPCTMKHFIPSKACTDVDCIGSRTLFRSPSAGQAYSSRPSQ